MSREVADYLVGHWSKVIDNNEFAYKAATGHAQSVVVTSGITRAEWLALSAEERVKRFGDEIGSGILDMIKDWCSAVLLEYIAGNVGGQLISEVLLFDHEIASGLGEHFIPEDVQVVDALAKWAG